MKSSTRAVTTAIDEAMWRLETQMRSSAAALEGIAEALAKAGQLKTIEGMLRREAKALRAAAER